MLKVLLVLCGLLCSFTTTLNLERPEKYIYIPNFGYVEHKEVPMTWHEAQQACALDQAVLWPMKSVTERDFVINSFYQAGIQVSSFWVGYSDLVYEGYWVAEDGFPMDQYALETLFEPGQPNGGTDENCALQFVGEGFHDYPCSTLDYAVCFAHAIPWPAEDRRT